MSQVASMKQVSALAEVKGPVAVADLGEAMEAHRPEHARDDNDRREACRDAGIFAGYMVECDGRTIGPFPTTGEAMRRGEEAFGDRPINLVICGPAPSRSQVF